METPDESLGDLAEENPEDVLFAIHVLLGDESIGRDEVIVAIAELAQTEGLNLPRLINEHPDTVEELWGESYRFEESTIERTEEIIDGKLA